MEFAAQLEELGIHTMSAVPVLSSQSGKAVGAIAVFDLDPDPLGLADADLDQACAALAEVAIERATDVAELSHQATHDPLTGLPNRIAAARPPRAGAGPGPRATARAWPSCSSTSTTSRSSTTASATAPATSCCSEVAAPHHRASRPGDTVARFGGDEFVVLCDDLARPSRRRRGGRPRRTAPSGHARRRRRRPRCYVTASIGIALSTPSADHRRGPVRDADVAMYRAKARGRARHEVFDDEHAHAGRATASSWRQRRCAWPSTRDELAPATTSRSSTLGTGRRRRASRRWCAGSTRRAACSAPATSSPSPRRPGSSCRIGRVGAATRRCRQIAEWQRSRSPLRPGCSVRVNLSARQLGQPDLVDDVARRSTSARHRPGPAHARDHRERAHGRLPAAAATPSSSCTALGVRLAVDDFGTGYSSLTYLRRFPSTCSRSTARSSAASARPQRGRGHRRAPSSPWPTRSGSTRWPRASRRPSSCACCRELGCDRAQGYLFARPVPADEVLPILERLNR